MAFLALVYYEKIKDFLHPNVNSVINVYRKDNIIELPPYHGCNHLNRNGTRKYIYYDRGYQCVLSTQKWYWRIKKDKYKKHSVYWTRYMTQCGIRHLFKNKGRLVFNYKLNKHIHLSKAPTKGYLRCYEVVKNQYKKCLIKYNFYTIHA